MKLVKVLDVLFSIVFVISIVEIVLSLYVYHVLRIEPYFGNYGDMGLLLAGIIFLFKNYLTNKIIKNE